MYTGSGGEPKREEVGMLRTVFLNAEGHRGAERAQRGGMAPPVCPRLYSKGSALSSQRASLRWKASSQSQRTPCLGLRSKEVMSISRYPASAINSTTPKAEVSQGPQAMASMRQTSLLPRS